MRIIKGIFIGIVICLIFLYLYQEKLVFFPQPVSVGQLQHIRNLGNKVEELTLTMKDGTKLHGWFAKNGKSAKHQTVIYFGGNGDELSYMVEMADKFAGWSIIFVNYRGYGSSEGKPSEENLCGDALAIYDYLANRNDVDDKKIVVMGRSLGTGVATYVAANRGIAGVILVSPYDKLSSPAKDAYPFLPVEMLLKYKFDSISRASSIKTPLLMLIGTEDTMILPQYSKKLAEKWGGQVLMQEIKGADHDSILSNKELWGGTARFLKEIGKSSDL